MFSQANGLNGVDRELISKLKLTSDMRYDSVDLDSYSPSGTSPGGTHRGPGIKHRTEPFLIGVAGKSNTSKPSMTITVLYFTIYIYHNPATTYPINP